MVSDMSRKYHRPRQAEISCLYEITKAIHSTLDLRQSLYKVLDLMAETLGMNRGSITIVNSETSEINIEVAHGLSISAQTKGRYKLGEGITGRVTQSGKPMVVPRIGDEPLFLNRTGARSHIDKSRISFICVPIKDGSRVIGTLSVDRIFEGTEPLEEDVRILSIISSLIAQKVALLEKINREKAQVNPYMFVDTGVPRLFQEVYSLGGKKERLIVKACGCGKPLGKNEMFRIGERNFTMLKKMLWKNNILLKAFDVGGNKSRTIKFSVEDGRVVVSNNGKEWEL